MVLRERIRIVSNEQIVSEHDQAGACVVGVCCLSYIAESIELLLVGRLLA